MHCKNFYRASVKSTCSCEHFQISDEGETAPPSPTGPHTRRPKKAKMMDAGTQCVNVITRLPLHTRGHTSPAPPPTHPRVPNHTPPIADPVCASKNMSSYEANNNPLWRRRQGRRCCRETSAMVPKAKMQCILGDGHTRPGSWAHLPTFRHAQTGLLTCFHFHCLFK